MFSNCVCRVVFTFFLATLAGCSTHPLVDDLTRKEGATFSIVQNTRCETRAMLLQVIQERIDSTHDRRLRSLSPDQIFDWPADVLRDRLHRDPQLLVKLWRYKHLTIAYQFNFDILEQNIKSADATFKLPFLSGGSFGLVTGAGIDKKRQAVRTFNLLDNGEALVRLLDCDGDHVARKNIAYPILGSVGMSEVVSTLSNIMDTGIGDGDFKDVLTFTTKIDDSLKPTLVLNSVSDQFRLTNLSGNWTDARTDKHKLTIIGAFPHHDNKDLTQLLGDLSRSELRALSADTKEDVKAKASVNLCIQDAINRDSTTGVISSEDPAISCQGTVTNKNFRTKSDPRKTRINLLKKRQEGEDIRKNVCQRWMKRPAGRRRDRRFKQFGCEEFKQEFEDNRLLRKSRCQNFMRRFSGRRLERHLERNNCGEFEQEFSDERRLRKDNCSDLLKRKQTSLRSRRLRRLRCDEFENEFVDELRLRKLRCVDLLRQEPGATGDRRKKRRLKLLRCEEFEKRADASPPAEPDVDRKRR